MADYSSDHAGALQDIADAGAPVVFTRTTPGTYDPTTNTSGDPVVTTVTGSAIRVKGDPDKYKALSLIESQAPTLLFAASFFGQLPKEGDSVVWSGSNYTVRDVNPVAPDGNAIIARIVVVQ